MELIYYNEMKDNLEKLIINNLINGKILYVFGHCNASEKLIDLLLSKKYRISAILDNNPQKQGADYKSIPIISPNEIRKSNMKKTVILIASRAYESMARQLRELGYSGRLEKLVDYNSFAEYSLSPDTIARKKERVMRGVRILEKLRSNYRNAFFILCPFSALGDVYYTMSYLPYFLENRGIKNFAVITVGSACADVAEMFACKNIELLTQTHMDELVQAVLFTKARDAYIAHHDRPYTNLLMKALYVKFIPFEQIYQCGVFGLSRDCRPYMPSVLKRFPEQAFMKKGHTVILSPYAKSSANVPYEVWEKIIIFYEKKGYCICTNIASAETALPGTTPLRAGVAEMRSAVEQAGIFIGVRSGLCDVIRDADCRKIVLFPDCYYSDTRWKTADFFHLDGWENIVVDKL